MSNLRNLPKIDRLAEVEGLRTYPRAVRVEAARLAVSTLRQQLQAGGGDQIESPEEAALRIAAELSVRSQVPVINASGVILHTGLGRARLAKEVADHVHAIAKSHSSLELDLDSGKRGDRQVHVRQLLCDLTGGESALVVNNCAAAVVLALSALAKGREVVLSRGQMIEIGGSFRMPEIIAASGCVLREVGCTNKTRIADFRAAISESTGALLVCHPSNYRVVGFTEHPSLAQVVGLGHEYGLPVIDDLGSGCSLDTTSFGLGRQPMVQDSLLAGADLVMFSGDKLLGGPQAGIVVGKSTLVETLARHPLARAMRADKLTLAALEATLRLYREGRTDVLPTIAALSKPLSTIRLQAQRIGRFYRGASVVERGTTRVGGGCAPDEGLPTWRVGLKSSNSEGLLESLRRSDPSVVARIEAGLVWLDPRTISAKEIQAVCRAVGSLVP